MALIGLPKREPVEAIKRKPLTKKQRAELFAFHHGICGICNLKILDSRYWRDEHMNALALGGGNELENRRPVHVDCAKLKDKIDKKLIAKGRRLRGETGNGYKKKIPSRPMPGTIASGLKKSFKGKVTKR